LPTSELGVEEASVPNSPLQVNEEPTSLQQPPALRRQQGVRGLDVDTTEGNPVSPLTNDGTTSLEPPSSSGDVVPEPVITPVPELDTMYIVRYRNNNGVISEKEVFKHHDSEPNTYTRYVFDMNNIPQKCSIPIFDIGEAIKKKYEPYCEEISLAPLGTTR
jgi:hypothetical protein